MVLARRGRGLGGHSDVVVRMGCSTAWAARALQLGGLDGFWPRPFVRSDLAGMAA